jgi:hypothetical protein|nr:hypothetical protein [uncultured Blautia sp.]
MAANDLSFNQLSTVLNSIVAQATGKNPLAITNTSEFISVAQTALKTGYDPLLQSISQVLSRTIFSTRPYYRKFGGIQVDNQKWGNITRKLNISDKDWENDVRFELVDGESVDMYKVNKPNILQTNFYGANVYERSYTIFKDQLDCAFSGPDEFARFLSMVTGNCTDMIEQAHENLARATVANYIGGKVKGDADSCIHLLTEYNALTGLALTKENVYQPANYKPFIDWVYSRIATLTELMTERSQLFHTNITGKTINRHTPLQRQRVYLYAPARFNIESMSLANTYNYNFLKMAYNETVNYWQSIQSPSKINVKPSYLQADGTITTPEAALEQDDIFGVIFDEEALGYTVMNQWSATTPFNAKGGYSNVFFHFTDRFWNDFTENGLVLLLD